MHTHIEAMVKSLVAVAWADGYVHEHEAQVLDALLAAFEVDAQGAALLRAYAAERKTLDDIPLPDLSADDRRMLLQHAVLLTYVDGEQVEEERSLLHQLAARLRIPPEEAQLLMELADRRAERLKVLLS